ncbi:hypothetical protein PG994_005590 [Apiospora phragmitis]|uniref:Uncharacterized protein n=1 Tax=Apiospora phragmitis TaxID=2905665 RepID=A0ABR1VG54_9PEZI
METSAPKRRKTSPSTSVPVGASNAPDDAANAGTTARDPPSRRPSFASPTKSSLARTNPDVLERQSQRRIQRSEATAGTSQLEAASKNEPPSVGQVLPSTQPPFDSGSQTPTRGFLKGGMTSRPRRTPNKPSSRPLPPPADRDEELLDPFRGQVLRRSPPPGVLPSQDATEPELPPPTPDKGTSDPPAPKSSPYGIHRTPTKRPRRSRALAEQMRSSPLKQPPTRPLEAAGRITAIPTSPSRSRPGPRRVSARLAAGSGKPHPARSVGEPDILSEKKAIRDALLAEVSQLETDLDMAKAENDNIHDTYGSQGARVGIQDKDGLLDLLRRHVLTAKPDSSPEDAWLEAALNPVSFLPFGNPAAIPALPFTERKEDEAPPPPVSHHPIPLNAAEELPYLQLFSPLVFRSSISLQPRASRDSGHLMQKHKIMAASSPQGLFAAKIEMTVDTKTLSISDLSVSHLEPSAAAELRPFIAKIEQGAINSALRRNISVVAWAMAEWTRLATKRALFWCHVQRELGTDKDMLRCAKKMRRGRKRKGFPGRPSLEDDDDSDEAELDDRYTNMYDTRSDVSRSALLPHMGRTSLDLKLGLSREVGLRIEWRIDFDWTGEGHSRIGALVETPGKWHHHDTRHSLVEIPGLFDKVVRGSGDPMKAVKTVVALIIGDRKG